MVEYRVVGTTAGIVLADSSAGSLAIAEQVAGFSSEHTHAQLGSLRHRIEQSVGKKIDTPQLFGMNVPKKDMLHGPDARIAEAQFIIAEEMFSVTALAFAVAIGTGAESVARSDLLSVIEICMLPAVHTRVQSTDCVSAAIAITNDAFKQDAERVLRHIAQLAVDKIGPI